MPSWRRSGSLYCVGSGATHYRPYRAKSKGRSSAKRIHLSDQYGGRRGLTRTAQRVLAKFIWNLPVFSHAGPDRVQRPLGEVVQLRALSEYKEMAPMRRLPPTSGLHLAYLGVTSAAENLAGELDPVLEDKLSATQVLQSLVEAEVEATKAHRPGPASLTRR